MIKENVFEKKNNKEILYTYRVGNLILNLQLKVHKYKQVDSLGLESLFIS